MRSPRKHLLRNSNPYCKIHISIAWRKSMTNTTKDYQLETIKQGSTTFLRSAKCDGWRLSLRFGRASLMLGVILVLMAGGCASKKIISIKNSADFQKKVVQSQKPVLVEFYKQGCPTCVVLESSLNKLADEYAGRVEFAKFELMSAVFVPQCPEIKEKYNLRYLFPTALLLVNGQEKQRWILKYDMDSYRQALDEVISPDRQNYGPDRAYDSASSKAVNSF